MQSNRRQSIANDSFARGLSASQLTRLPAFLVVIGSLLLVIGCGARSPAEQPRAKASDAKLKEVTVAAASDLKFVLPEIIAEFEAQFDDVKINPTFGASGSFFAQLSNQAPFDLFLSADISYPEKLIESGLGDKDTLFSYAIGKIVIWVPKNSPLDVETLGVKTLEDPNVQKIAIANPKHAPYGRAAMEALRELGVYEQVADRLVLGENVAQTAQFVESGAADVGIIAMSLALAPALRENGRFWLIPETAHAPILQGGVVMNWAKDRSATELFRKFLMGDRGQAMLQDRGFKAVKEKPEDGTKRIGS